LFGISGQVFDMRRQIVQDLDVKIVDSFLIVKEHDAKIVDSFFVCC